MKPFPVTAPFPVSANVSRMQPSSTLAAMQAAEALRAAGADVVDFGNGEHDFDTPENIKPPAAETMPPGQKKDPLNGGTRVLHPTIFYFYHNHFGTRYATT